MELCLNVYKQLTVFILRYLFILFLRFFFFSAFILNDFIYGWGGTGEYHLISTRLTLAGFQLVVEKKNIRYNTDKTVCNAVKNNSFPI